MCRGQVPCCLGFINFILLLYVYEVYLNYILQYICLDKTKKQSRSRRAGIKLPVGRVHRYLKDGQFARRVSADSAVFLSAALEYLCGEILELAGNVAEKSNRNRWVDKLEWTTTYWWSKKMPCLLIVNERVCTHKLKKHLCRFTYYCFK